MALLTNVEHLKIQSVIIEAIQEFNKTYADSKKPLEDIVKDGADKVVVIVEERHGEYENI